MSFSDRLAELYEILAAFGGAVLVLVVLAFVFGRLGSKSSLEVSGARKPQQPGDALETTPTRENGKEKQPFVQSIYIAPSAGKPMERVRCAKAVARRGLVGDRYFSEVGRWSGTDDSEVTLIAKEGLDTIAARSDINIQNGEHRRNIVTKDLSLEELAGKRFYVGSALFGYDRPRPPCAYIETITEAGMAKALGRNSGICARCIKSGVVQDGDSIKVVQITVWDALRYRATLAIKKRKSSYHNDLESL